MGLTTKPMVPKSTKLNAEQLHVLQHSLGADRFGKTQYSHEDEGDGCFEFPRNRYVSDPTPLLAGLVAMGLLADHGAVKCYGGMHLYMVTPDGRMAMLEQSDQPPKLTRSQERYRRYLKAADCFESFRDFLVYEGRKEAA